MEKELYRRVMCSDRLPKERKWFDTDKGYLLFSITQNQWLVSDEYYPKWWLEEIELPSEGEIEKLAENNGCRGIEAGWFIVGANKAIKLIKGGK